MTTDIDIRPETNSGSSADSPKHGHGLGEEQWAPRPWLARAIRGFAFLFPVAMSVVFVILAARVVPAPAGWFGRALWWIGMTVGATGVLIVVERLTRRLLPLVTLFKLSIAFPDEAPSRFKMAMRTNTVRQLERRLHEGSVEECNTPTAAAIHLLELANMLNSHDRLTRGHTERVRAYTLMIGEQMGLPADDLNKLHWAALIHDVGKLEVPPEILNKDGRPTDDEWLILRDHPKHGGELVKPLVPWLGEWAKAAEQHHERWDGRGYPYALSGHQISRAGRIVAVADAFDVITSVRSYKAAFTPAEARAELARCAGTQFDPAVVRAFLNVSLGRLRLAMGPLSWLAQLPVLFRIPLTAGIGTTTASGGGAALAATAGMAATGFAAMTGLAAPTILGSADDVGVAVPAVTSAQVSDVVDRLEEDTDFDISPESLGTADADVVSPGDPDVGGVALLDDGTVRYQPPADYFGPARFEVEGCWADDCQTATVSLDVLPVNDAPRPGVDAVTMLEDGRIGVDVLANDIDPEGDELSLVSASADEVSLNRRQESGPAGLDLQVIGGKVWLAPPDDYHGTVSVNYRVADAAGAEAGGRVTVAIGSVNDAPVVLDDTASGAQGAQVRVSVLDNDYDVDGDVLDVTRAGSSTLRPTLDGNVVVVPLDGSVGEHVVDYSVVDGDGAANDARVVVTITEPPSTPRPPNPPPPTSTPAPTTTPPPVAPPVNQPPVIGSRSLSIDEDTDGVVDIAAATTDVDGSVDASTLTIVVPPNGTLGTATVFDGAIVFGPRPNAFGATSTKVSICDDDGACATTTVPIVVKPVNDPPVFSTLSDRIIIQEDAELLRGPFVTDIAAGPANEADQSVSFSVAHPPAAEGLFDVPPFVSVAGTIRLRPAPDASGSTTLTITATDSGTVGGAHRTAVRTITIIVREVNDAPSFGASGPFAVFEDSGPYSAVWALDITPGPALEAAQSVSFTVAVPPADAGLFAVAPTMDDTGRLRFTPAADKSGSTTLVVTARDSGGTAQGGVDSAPPVNLGLAIFEVNDPPTVAVAPGSVTVDEDSGGYDGLWASGISPGPPSESAQQVSFDVEVPPGDLALFSEVPNVSADGVLHFTPAINGHGATTITVRPVDDGGTPNGGSDTGADEAVTITIDPINDAPTFTKGANVVVVENSGPQTIPAWASDIAVGPNETGQSVTFVTTVVGGGLTFAADPVVAPDGDLTFETAFAVTGTATVEVYAVDDGPSGGGHVSQSASKTFTITATPAANQAPVAGDFPVGGLEDGGFIDIDVSSYISDPDDLVTSLSASLDVAETSHGASVSVVGARTIRFTPAPDVYGADSFSYTIADPDMAVDTGVITVNLASTPDAPVADDDGYQVFKNTQLSVPVPLGVLGNDVDVDPGALTAAVVSPPPVGSLVLAADGSFTYDPPTDFTGTTSFTYRATGAGGSDVTTVRLLVDSGAGTPVVHLGQTGADSEHFDFLFSPPAAANPEPDVDADGADGLTLADAGVPGTSGDPARSHNWALEVPSFADLDGPAYLNVWSQVRDPGSMGPDAMLRAQVYECDPALTSCTLFAEAAAHDENWSAGWALRVINLGHVTRTLTPGKVLKLHLESTHADLLIAASGNRASRLVGTTVNKAPEVTDLDFTGANAMLEGASLDIDLLMATADIDIEPWLTAVTAGPGNGSIVDNGDGTVRYTPDAGFSGDDQFDFELTDSIGQTGSGTVFIRVLPVNGVPLMTAPPGPLSIWLPEATGTVQVDGDWVITFDVDRGYETGYQIGQYWLQSPLGIVLGNLSPGIGEYGEELEISIESITDAKGVINTFSGFVLEPGEWLGFYRAPDYHLFLDFTTNNTKGVATVVLRLDDTNATDNLSTTTITIVIDTR